MSTTPSTRSIPELSQDSRALANELESTPVGQVVTYTKLSAVIGRDIKIPSAYALLHSARERLVKHKGIVFEVVRGQGLKRLDDAAIAASAPGRVKRVHKVAKRETRKLLCADQSKLSNADRITHNAAVAMIGTIAEVTRPKQLTRLERRLEQSNPSRLTLEATLDAFKPSPGETN